LLLYEIVHSNRDTLALIYEFITPLYNLILS